MKFEHTELFDNYFLISKNKPHKFMLFKSLRCFPVDFCRNLKSCGGKQILSALT